MYLQQGLAINFQLTSLVASDNLDVTSQKKMFTSQVLMLVRSNKQHNYLIESTKQATLFNT